MPEFLSSKADSVGSGIIFITASKVYWLLLSYILVLFLPRIMSVENYGLWGVVMGVINVFNMVVIMGINQGVSRYISSDEAHDSEIRWAAFKIQSCLGGGIFLALIISADFISHFFNDISLVNYFRLSAFITLFYTFYAGNTGYLNGKRYFKKQAMLNMLFVSLKVVFILFICSYSIKKLGQNGVMGAIGGFALAAFIILIVSFIVSGFQFNLKVSNYKSKDILRFTIWIIIFTFLLNLLMNIDLLLVKKLISPIKNVAYKQTGYYTAALTISRISYSFMMAAAIIIFPLISKITSLNNTAATKKYINSILKFSFIIVIGIAAVISHNARMVISILLGERYSPGGEVLSVLIFAIAFMVMFVLSTTIFSGSGRPILSIFIAIITLTIDAILNIIFIPRFGLLGASYARSIALIVGFSLCQFFLVKYFSSCLKLLTILRTLGVAVMIYLLSMLIQTESNYSIFVKLAFLGILYLFFLFAIKEISRKDTQELILVFKKRI